MAGYSPKDVTEMKNITSGYLFRKTVLIFEALLLSMQL